MRHLLGAGLSRARRPEWAARPERGGARLKRLAVRLALAAGRAAAGWALYPVTAYFLAASPRERAASRRYLRRVLGREPGFIDAFSHFHAFATTLLDRVYLLRGQYGRYEIRLFGEEAVQQFVRGREGCLLVGAHFGSFEVIRFAGLAAGIPSVSLVMYEDNARELRDAIDAVNPAYAMPVIPLGRPDAMLRVDEALHAGGFVGMLADRALGSEGRIACDFLGGEARFPLGPFRMAALLRRPLVLMLGIYRGGRRYDIHFETLADFRGISRADRDRAAEEALRRYAARLEQYCRSAPFNWFNFHDDWT